MGIKKKYFYPYYSNLAYNTAQLNRRREEKREKKKKKKLKHERFIAYQARRHVFNVENSPTNERGASRWLLIRADSRWTTSSKFHCSEKKKGRGGGEERKKKRKERNDFVSRELVAGCLMTHRLAEYTSISPENYRYIPTYFIGIIASTSSATPSVSFFFLFLFVRSRAMRVYTCVYRADYTRYKSTHLRSLVGNLNVGTI